MRRVPDDRAYDLLDDGRRESIFEDVRGDAEAAEAQAQAAAAAEAALLRARHEQRENLDRQRMEQGRAASATSNGADEQEILRNLRAEQVCCVLCY